MTGVRLEIDWTRCDGHGLCQALLPARVAMDEWGFPMLHHPEIDTAGLPAARRAVAACPALALRLDALRPDTAIRTESTR